MKKVYLFIIFCAFAGINRAQAQYKCNGVVTDLDQNVVKDAIVILHPSEDQKITDAAGRFAFTNLNSGAYSLETIASGFVTSRQHIVITHDTILQIRLKRLEVDLESVTISADPGQALHTFTAIDFDLRPTQSAQDLLRLVPGLFIAQHAGGGKAEQIFLRGFDIDHGTDIHIEVDGMPVNMVSHAHGQGYADLHFVIPETIASCTFEKGSYDAAYGDFATTGNVQFNTKNDLHENTIEAGLGMFNSFRGFAMLNVWNSLESGVGSAAYVAGEYTYSDGPFISPQHFRRTNIFTKYYHAAKNKDIFTVSASTFSSAWDASGQVPARAVESGMIDRFGSIDDNEGGNTSRTNLIATYTKKLSSDDYVKQEVYYTRYAFSLYSNFTFFLEDSLNGDMIHQEETRDLAGYSAHYVHSHFLLGKKAGFELGAGIRYDAIHDVELSHVYERDSLLNILALGDMDEINYNAWIREHLFITKKISISASLRYDRFSFAYFDKLENADAQKQDGILSYTLQFDMRLRNDLLLYWYSGKGFHSNDTRVVVNDPPIQTLPAAYDSDLGLQWKAGKRLLLNPALWILYLEQEFVYVGDAAIVEPSGETFRMGADLSMRFQAAKWLYIDMDLNYTHARALDAPAGENFIPLAAGFTSVGGMLFTLPSGFDLSLRYRYMADRPANEDNSITALGYFVNDATMHFTKGSWKYGIEIQNIYNVDWNEAQFATESRLQGETYPVEELHFTPGTPFNLKATVALNF